MGCFKLYNVLHVLFVSGGIKRRKFKTQALGQSLLMSNWKRTEVSNFYLTRSTTRFYNFIAGAK